MTKKNQRLPFAFLLIVITFPLISFSQNKTTSKSTELTNMKSILERRCFDKISWQVQDAKPEYKPVYAMLVINDIDKYLLNWRPNDDSLDIAFRPKKIFSLIKKYRSSFEKTFLDLQSSEADKFLYFHRSSLPIYFGLFKDSALSLLFSGVVSDNVYNTLRLTAKERAAKVIATYILPALRIVAEDFNTKEIKYFGFSCVYGSKDFGNDEPNGTKAEFISFLAPSDLVRKYNSSDITESELVNAADIYISDRDMQLREIKKIRIAIE